MKSIFTGAFAGAVLLTAIGCSQDTTGMSEVNSSASLNGAFTTAIMGFANIHSSFDGGDSLGVWGPEGRGHRGPPGASFGGPGHERGPGGPEHGLGDLLMGGGLGGAFRGDGLGAGFGHGHFGLDGFTSSTCVFAVASGRVVCAAEIRNGVTVNRSAAYATAAGAVQQAFDSLTTNTINVKVSAAGTFTRRDSAVVTVSNSSDRTVTGIAPGSTKRTVNATSSGRENIAGTNAAGSFTAVRTQGDTTKALIIPVATTATPHPYPTSGTVIRSMSATVTHAGAAATTSTRREVITYDGSATAKIVITKDGVTQNCTVALPNGHPSCL